MEPDTSPESYERVDCMGRVVLRVFSIPQEVPYNSDATEAFRAFRRIGEAVSESKGSDGTARRRNLKRILPSV